MTPLATSGGHLLPPSTNALTEPAIASASAHPGSAAAMARLGASQAVVR